MRSLVATVILVLAALMVPVATAGWWLRDAIVPTDGYVATVTPLATDPAVVAAVEKRLVSRTMQAVDRIDQLSGPLVRPQVERLVTAAVVHVVEGDAFVKAWQAANRAAHDQLVAVLSGDSSALEVRGGTVDVRLATLSTAVRQEMIDAGVPFARLVPVVQASYPVGDVADLARAQRAYTALDRWGRLLPLVTLALLAVGLLVARRRGRALAWTAVASLLGLGALALGLVVGRAVYLTRVPSDVSQSAASAVYDTLTAGLRHDLLLVGVVALLALVAGLALSRLSRH